MIRTHNQHLGETLAYALYVEMNGTEVKVKDLGTKVMAGNSYVLDASFDLSYAALTTLVAGVTPGMKVGPGTGLAVWVSWPGGHDQGAGGAGGRGAHRLTAP